jgi:hypothetical protein
MWRHPEPVPTALIILLFLTSPAAAVQQEEFILTAEDAAADDFFGLTVAVGGDLVLVGASQDDVTLANGRRLSNVGAVYGFSAQSGQQLFKLISADAEAGDRFGTAVAVSEQNAIIGAIGADKGGSSVGAAYIFDTVTGQQLFKLAAPDGAYLDRFGGAVDIHGNVAIVGARGVDRGAVNTGAAYLFDALTGNYLSTLTATDLDESDHFGDAVATNGALALVGAPLDDAAGINSGAAYVFDVVTGVELFKLSPSDASPFSAFGKAVAVSGNIAVIGAHIKSDVAEHSGAAYLFDVTTGQQLHKLELPLLGPDDRFGFSVAIDGDLVIVGAFRDLLGDPNRGPGVAYIFDLRNGQLIGTLGGSDAEFGTWFGQSVAIDGQSAVVGSPLAGDPLARFGSAFVFAGVPEPTTVTMFVAAIPIIYGMRTQRRAPQCCASHSAALQASHLGARMLRRVRNRVYSLLTLVLAFIAF